MPYQPPPKILVDTSILSDANIGKWYDSLHSAKWGPHDVHTRVAGVRVVLPDNQEKKKQILALPTIARLARDGRITLLKYSELSFENMYGPRSARGTQLDLFAGLNIDAIDPAIDRSYFGGLRFPGGMRGSALQSFCDLLLNPGFKPDSLPSEILDRLPPTSRMNILNIDRYRKICSHAPKKHFRDLFHLWTGEVNSCIYFLTMESKLPHFFNSHKVNSKCIPIRPLELVATLGITELDPLPFPEGSVVDAFSAMNIFHE